MLSFKKSLTTQGIERCHRSELPAEFYSLVNKWSGIVAGRHVMVYAGSLTHNPGKGVLLARTLPSDSRRIGAKHLAVPSDCGALQIVESRGSRLRIAMARGGSFWFEVSPALRAAA